MQLDEITDYSINLLTEMVGIPSLSGQEAPLTTFLEDSLRLLSPDSVQRRGNNLIAMWGGAHPGPTLLLCSHLDTVAPASGWTRNPYKASIEGERIYGLGTNDAGASVVSMIGALRAIKPFPAGRVILCLAAEEEAGSHGFVAIESLLPRYDAAIFGEPTNMGFAGEMRGAMKLAMHSRGKSCHASRPWEGQNALDVFAADLAKIRSIDLSDNSRWGGANIEPTTIQGGKSANQIPDLIVTTLDIRTTPTKDNEWILAQLKGLGIEFYIDSNKRQPMSNISKHPLMRAVTQSSPVCIDYTFNGTCDMSFAAATSIVMGPGRSERSHAADEFCTKGEIRSAIEIYAAVIQNYLAHAE